MIGGHIDFLADAACKPLAWKAYVSKSSMLPFIRMLAVGISLHTCKLRAVLSIELGSTQELKARLLDKRGPEGSVDYIAQPDL